MKIWLKAPVDTLCGGCGDLVVKGALILVLSTPEHRWVRCRKCRTGDQVDEGGTPVPVVDREPVSALVTRARQVFTRIHQSYLAGTPRPAAAPATRAPGRLARQLHDRVILRWTGQGVLRDREPGEEG